MTIQTGKQEKDCYEAEFCDTGLKCLLLVASTLGVVVEEEKIRATYASNKAMDTRQLLQAAKLLKLKAKVIKVQKEELAGIKIPSIAIMKDGTYLIIGKNNLRKMVVFNSQANRSEALTFEAFLAIWSGEVIAIKKPFSLQEAGQQFNVAWFIPIIVKYKKIFRDVFIASFFLQLFGLITPLFTQVIIDKVLTHKGVATLDVLALALLVAGLFQMSMNILRTYLAAHTTNKIDLILGARLFHHLIALPLRYFELRRVGDTLVRVSALHSIREFLTGSAMTIFLDAFFSIVFMMVMFYYSVSLSLIALIALPLYVLQNFIATPLYRERVEAVWANGAESNAFLVEAITGVHTIKSLALEPQFNHKWEMLLSKYIRATFQSSTFNMISGSFGTLIQSLTGLGVLLFGGHKVMNGEMTIGQLIAFQMLATQVSAPILRLSGIWQSCQQTALSVERLGDILNTAPEPTTGMQGGNLPSVGGNILFHDVTFRYHPEGPEILRHVNLQIQPGMKIGIVGRSGSGKSTLTKLVQRLYLPESGLVSIDGVDVTHLDPTWFRRQIGVVLQENFLFTGSVRDNIAIARPSASIEEVIYAAKMAGAHDFIIELTEGYDAEVGERGMSLSGGQQQRIAIARAILTNPAILIFDEATSALDYESERIIMNHLDQISKGRTMLMIAHRLSTVRRCERIIVMEQGEVVEQGTHEELMALAGHYYKLYKQQEV